MENTHTRIQHLIIKFSIFSDRFCHRSNTLHRVIYHNTFCKAFHITKKRDLKYMVHQTYENLQQFRSERFYSSFKKEIDNTSENVNIISVFVNKIHICQLWSQVLKNTFRMMTFHLRYTIKTYCGSFIFRKKGLCRKYYLKLRK